MQYLTEQKEALISEIDKLDNQQLLNRIADIDTYLTYGKVIKWGLRRFDSPLLDLLNLADYEEDQFYINYRKLLNMKLLDKCTSFTLWPKLAFTF